MSWGVSRDGEAGDAGLTGWHGDPGLLVAAGSRLKTPGWWKGGHCWVLDEAAGVLCACKSFFQKTLEGAAGRIWPEIGRSGGRLPRCDRGRPGGRFAGVTGAGGGSVGHPTARPGRRLAAGVGELGLRGHGVYGTLSEYRWQVTSEEQGRRFRTRHGAALAEGLLGCGCMARAGASSGSRCCPEAPSPISAEDDRICLSPRRGRRSASPQIRS